MADAFSASENHHERHPKNFLGTFGHNFIHVNRNWQYCRLPFASAREQTE
jgi:hypothetical protein